MRDVSCVGSTLRAWDPRCLVYRHQNKSDLAPLVEQTMSLVHRLSGLTRAAALGRCDAILALVQRGATINGCSSPHRMRPLHYAALLGRAPAVYWLVRLGADVNYRPQVYWLAVAVCL